MKFGWTHENELKNGRFAMMGFVAAVISYVTTGSLFFGVW